MTLALVRILRCDCYVRSQQGTRLLRAVASTSASQQQKKTKDLVDELPAIPKTNLRLDAPTATKTNTEFTTKKFTSTPTPPSGNIDENNDKIYKTNEKTQRSQEIASSTPSALTTKQKLSPQTVRQNVQGYVFTRYIDYVKNYDKLLEEKFPKAVKVYRVFFDGVKDFYMDMKRYLKISRIVYDAPQGLRALNRQELELYMQMPRDMVKVAPALILSSLPMIGYAIFPLVFMYPRTFLTSHFWSLQQRVEFQQLKLQERLHCNRPVLRCMQDKLEKLGHEDQHKLEHAQLSEILGLLGSGFHPSVQSILDIKHVFAKPPYSLLSLNGKHIKLLTQMHGLPWGLFKRHRLSEHAFLIHHMDLAIKREGGVHNMHLDAISSSCRLRGLNPSNLSNEEMVEWLRNWIKVSTSIQEEHISLFLHLPLFLAYNHPNNWQLIYCSHK